MTFRLALSGLNAAQTDLKVTANNIANGSTTGFKSSRAEFAELFAVSPQGVSNLAVGNGVRVSDVSQQFTQGSVDFTENSLDLALSGDGFFTLSNNGALSYTRAGAFHKDAEGFVVNAQSQRLQVYPPSATGGFNTGTLTDLRLSVSESAPAATTAVEVIMNLPAADAAPTTATFDPADTSSYNRATSMTMYDSLGSAHTATHVLHAHGHGEPVERPAVRRRHRGRHARRRCDFSNTGAMVNPASGQISFAAYTPTTGAAPMNMTFDVGGATQYGATFGVNSVTQDGYTTGRLIGMDIDKSGVVQARYTNGRSTTLGQVALSNFSNPNGLQQLADTTWAETFAFGPGAERPGRQLGLRPDPVRRARSIERRRHDAARQHDHRAAQLPGERADDLDVRPDHPDDHQHPLIAD